MILLILDSTRRHWSVRILAQRNETSDVFKTQVSGEKYIRIVERAGMLSRLSGKPESRQRLTAFCLCPLPVSFATNNKNNLTEMSGVKGRLCRVSDTKKVLY
jgi:hypothetical protein